MHRFELTVLVGVLVLVCFISVTCSGKHIREEKPQNAVMRLCGVDFMQAWKLECLLKIKPLQRKKRSIQEFAKPKDSWFMPETAAKTFIRKLSRLRRNTQAGERDTALEECCIEGCMLEEVAEYPC